MAALQRRGDSTPAAPPPRRTGSAAARYLSLPSTSRADATPIVGAILMVGSSGEVSLIANDCPSCSWLSGKGGFRPRRLT